MEDGIIILKFVETCLSTSESYAASNVYASKCCIEKQAQGLICNERGARIQRVRPQGAKYFELKPVGAEYFEHVPNYFFPPITTGFNLNPL